MPLKECPDCKKEVSDQAPACPNCGHPFSTSQPTKEKTKKKGVGCGGAILIIFGLIVGLMILGNLGDKGNKSGSKGASQSGRLSESSSEYQEMALKHMGIVTTDPDIDSAKVDGSLFYINFSRPQTKQEYLLVAKTNAIKFSNFKKSKLGVSGVTVFITYKGNMVAQASARNGQITDAE